MTLLKKRPRDFSVLHLLGVCKGEQGHIEQAISVLENARGLPGSDDAVHGNLGKYYLAANRVEDAIDSCMSAIRLNAKNGYALHNLGNALTTAQRLPEAEKAFLKALAILPQYPLLYYSIGCLYLKQGRLMDAVQQFIHVNDLDAAISSVFIRLCRALMFMHNTEDAARVAAIGLDSGVLTRAEELELAVEQAIVSWLTGDIDLTRQALIRSRDVFSPDFDEGNLANPRMYAHCLHHLLTQRKLHAELYRGNPEQAIFFASESHCLSPSETVVRYHGREYRILSTLITGCKAWHLQQDEPNEYKASLEALFAAVPARSLIVLGFGEIDCRWNEGILPAHREKGIDFTRSIPEIIRRYLDFAEHMAAPREHGLLVYGVPAPSVTVLDNLTCKEADLLVDIIRRFNQSLAKEALRRGLDFLDVYALTRDASGRSNMCHHIDIVHLHPSTVPRLFTDYLVCGGGL